MMVQLNLMENLTNNRFSFKLKSFIILFTLIHNFQSGFSQRCATHSVFEHNAAAYPIYGNYVNQAFQQAKEWVEQNPGLKSGDVYQIPVVVHILYTNATQNIDDSLVYNQIAVLNEDFRRLNADTINTRSEFLSIAADAKIEFYLATIDPNGNPTTGITRTAGTPAFGTYTPFDDNAKFDSLGGKNAWPTNKYLNIWVCDILFGFGILGYAYPPMGNVPNWDAGVAPADPGKQGVVIHYAVFGKNNPNATGPLSAVNRGRTVTHEVGHFLGLRHIWGDGDCTQDDGITDTPPAASDAQQVCDWTKNTCTETSGPELPDNIENYMDYAADSCMNMFTQGQVNIMRYVLENFRQELVGLPVSIHEQQVASGSVAIYPNPANEILNVQVLNSEISFIQPHEILDLNGRSIIQFHGTKTQISHLPTGLYALRIHTNYGMVVKKFIKQ